MIWLRRILAVLLIPIFILLFLVALLLIRVNDTALSAGFYVDQLKKADIFTFMYDKVAPAALKDVSKDAKNMPIDVEKVGNKALPLLRQVFPPDWLEKQTEQTILQVVPYLEGSQPGFKVVVPLNDRIQAAVPGVKKLMRDEDVYNKLFDQLITKLVKDSVGQQVSLALGLTLSADDIITAVQQALPPEYLQSQAENMVDQVAPYVTGDSKTFKVVVPLKDRKQAAISAIQKLADKKLQELIASSRPCTVKESLDLAQKGLTGALPPCLPKGSSLDEIKRALGINIPGITQQQIEKQLGISLDILIKGVTADTIKQTFGIDIAAQVSQFVGKVIPDDYTFTDVDLRKVLSDKDETTLDNALDVTRNGFKYTEADLRKSLSDSRDGKKTLNTIDNVRKWVGLERKLTPLYYLVPALLLAAIGFLGGRRWRSRLAWAAVPLFIASGMAYVTFGPVYHAVVEPMVNKGFADAAKNATGVALLVTQKGTSVAQSAINNVISGLATQALVLLIISVVALAVAILWPKLFRQPRSPAPDPTPRSS